MSQKARFCPCVPVHKGITIVLSLFRSHWLGVVYCLVFCTGSCEPVHEDRTKSAVEEKEILDNAVPRSTRSVNKWAMNFLRNGRREEQIRKPVRKNAGRLWKLLNSRSGNEHLRHDGRISKLLADEVHYGSMQRLFVNVNFE